MIVLASDYVGLRVVEHLVEHGHLRGFVALDPRDLGGYNSKIALAARSRRTDVVLVDAGELDRPEILDRLAQSEPRLGILAWWPRILKGRLLTIPKMGWLNLHPSLLPFNRGRNPNFWCLVDDTPCGVSLQLIDEGVDTGPVVAQTALPISWEDTGETVYRRSRERILDLFKENLEHIMSGARSGSKQDIAAGTFHRSGEMDEISCIDLDQPSTARRLFNIIRARTFPPHPTAWFRDGGKTYSVRIQIEEMENDLDG